MARKEYQGCLRWLRAPRLNADIWNWILSGDCYCCYLFCELWSIFFSYTFAWKWFRTFLRGWFLDLPESFDSPISISPRQGQADNGYNTRASVTAGFSNKVTVFFWHVYLCEMIADLQVSWQEGRCFRGETYIPSFGYQIDTIHPKKLEFPQKSCGGRRERVEALELGRAGPCFLKEISHNSGYSQERVESRHLWVNGVHDNSLARMA